MSGLEAQYRRAMSWYPKAWRAANEDAMLGTLMDAADETHRSKPTRGELGHIRGSAIVFRLGPLGRIPGPVRDRAAALAFGLGSGIAIVALIALAVQKATIAPYFVSLLPSVGPFIGYSFLFFGTWVLSFVAGIIGWKRAARLLAVAAILIAIILRFTTDSSPFSVTTSTTIALMTALALLTFLGNPFRFRRGRVWIAVSALSWSTFMGLTIWYQHASHGGQAGRTDWFIGPLWQWLYWIVPFALILAIVLMRLFQSAWGGAILILLLPIIPFVVFGWSPRIDEVIDRGALLAIAIGIICVVYFVPRLWRFRIDITRVER